MTMTSWKKQPSLIQLISLRNALATWKEILGWIGKPYRNSRQHLLIGRHSKQLFLGITQMHEILNILWLGLTSLLKNIHTRNFYPSRSLQLSTDSSDGSPIIYWPPTMFLNLKSRRPIPRASTQSFAG